MLDTLEQVKLTLTSTLSSPALFSLVNTRVMLRTGVDLGEIKPAENRNQAAVSKVLTVLSAMGYSLQPDSAVRG